MRICRIHSHRVVFGYLSFVFLLCDAWASSAFQRFYAVRGTIGLPCSTPKRKRALFSFRRTKKNPRIAPGMICAHCFSNNGVNLDRNSINDCRHGNRVNWLNKTSLFRSFLLIFQINNIRSEKMQGKSGEFSVFIYRHVFQYINFHLRIVDFGAASLRNNRSAVRKSRAPDPAPAPLPRRGIT